MTNTKTAAEHLDTALASMAERGERPPCTADPDGLWFGDTSTHRAEAARICIKRCPLVLECRAVAKELPATWRTGVWGGHDYTRTRPKKRRAAAPEPQPIDGLFDYAFEAIAEDAS
jgi:hypothetical protein